MSKETDESYTKLLASLRDVAKRTGNESLIGVLSVPLGAGHMLLVPILESMLTRIETLEAAIAEHRVDASIVAETYTEVAAELPPVGCIVVCKREGEWSAALGVWSGKTWEGKGAPVWYKDTSSLMPMKAPTHWRYQSG